MNNHYHVSPNKCVNWIDYRQRDSSGCWPRNHDEQMMTLTRSGTDSDARASTRELSNKGNEEGERDTEKKGWRGHLQFRFQPLMLATPFPPFAFDLLRRGFQIKWIQIREIDTFRVEHGSHPRPTPVGPILREILASLDVGNFATVVFRWRLKRVPRITRCFIRRCTCNFIHVE